jgi:hypothetical protein
MYHHTDEQLCIGTSAEPVPEEPQEPRFLILGTADFFEIRFLRFLRFQLNLEPQLLALRFLRFLRFQIFMVF